MTIADRIVKRYSKIAQDCETGLMTIAPYDFLRKKPEWKLVATHCPESCDSSVTVQFMDGSQVYLDNPGQVAFCGHIEIRPQQNERSDVKQNI